MNKAKAREIPDVGPISNKPLIRLDYTYVMVSHQELDDLIARLMHLAELDSDKEHRDALKGELKHISRSWLDNLYSESGYKLYDYIPGAQIVEIEENEGNQTEWGPKVKASVLYITEPNKK